MAGEDWDRRQAAEDRWRNGLTAHDDDPGAHHERFHTERNAQAVWQLTMERKIAAIELARAEEHGEWRATRRMVSVVGGVLGLLVTAFGGAILVKLGAI